MTQEEKIQDMLDNPLIYCNSNYQNLVLWAAKEMAEWKNKEFKDRLEKKKSEFESKRDKYTINDFTYGYWASLAEVFKEMINEVSQEE